MSDPRAEVLGQFKLATHRPVRWVSERRGLEFEGREFTIEIFDVADTEQKAMFMRLASVRAAAASLVGREVRVLFHTPEATTQHYPYVREQSSDATAG